MNSESSKCKAKGDIVAVDHLVFVEKNDKPITITELILFKTTATSFLVLTTLIQEVANLSTYVIEGRSLLSILK